MSLVFVALLVVPFATGLLSWLVQPQKLRNLINVSGATGTLVLGIRLAVEVFARGPVKSGSGALYADALSAFVVLIVSALGFASALYSVGYMNREIQEGAVVARRLGRYYLWLHIFVFTMLFVAIADNLGVMWVAIEATTLASALLVAFYNKEASLEAAWKYIMICTVGITFALFGTILTYYSSLSALGEARGVLNWSTLVKVADKLDPKMIKLAFIFVLIGYGTKAGLAPMHTWLPDAHSQAPSPVSALLSGVLLNCALYGILRFHIITIKTVGPAFSSQLLLIFGLLSIGVAVPFLLLQHDFKRLLAYSSVEHIGIITAGIGIGGTLGLYGALLHLFNHAFAKSLMFFVAGNITQYYNTKKIARIRGVAQAYPVAGALLLLGAFAIAGSPPFSPFLSEFAIVSAGFAGGHAAAAVLFLFFLALVFGGVIYYVTNMAFGAPPPRVGTGKNGPLKDGPPKSRGNAWSAAAILLPLALVVVMGVYIPAPLDSLLHQVVQVIGGVARP
ncbi:MAG: hydrogenase 4 subunit F [Syntrophothermus sp.]